MTDDIETVNECVRSMMHFESSTRTTLVFPDVTVVIVATKPAVNHIEFYFVVLPSKLG